MLTPAISFVSQVSNFNLWAAMPKSTKSRCSVPGLPALPARHITFEYLLDILEKNQHYESHFQHHHPCAFCTKSGAQLSLSTPEPYDYPGTTTRWDAPLCVFCYHWYATDGEHVRETVPDEVVAKIRELLRESGRLAIQDSTSRPTSSSPLSNSQASSSCYPTYCASQREFDPPPPPPAMARAASSQDEVPPGPPPSKVPPQCSTSEESLLQCPSYAGLMTSSRASSSTGVDASTMTDGMAPEVNTTALAERFQELERQMQNVQHCLRTLMGDYARRRFHGSFGTNHEDF